MRFTKVCVLYDTSVYIANMGVITPLVGGWGCTVTFQLHICTLCTCDANVLKRYACWGQESLTLCLCVSAYLSAYLYVGVWKEFLLLKCFLIPAMKNVHADGGM